MAHDAPEQSLNEHDRALLEAACRAARQAARQELLRVAAAADSGPVPAPAPPPPRRGRRTPKDKRWLHVVRGAVPVSAAGAFVRGHVRHAIAVSAGAVVLAGGTLAPDLMHPAPPPAYPATHSHRAGHSHGVPPAPTASPAVVPVKRKRRRLDNDTVTHHPSPSPSPAGPAPDPSPTVPLPVPLPSAAVPPVPTPDPTCTPLHGHHCHGGDVVGDVVSVLGALRGLNGQP